MFPQSEVDWISFLVPKKTMESCAIIVFRQVQGGVAHTGFLKDVWIRSCFTFPPWYFYSSSMHIIVQRPDVKIKGSPKYPEKSLKWDWWVFGAIFRVLRVIGSLYFIHFSSIWGNFPSFEWFPRFGVTTSWPPAAAKKNQRNPGATIITHWSSCEASMNLEKLASQIERAKKWMDALELEK